MSGSLFLALLAIQIESPGSASEGGLVEVVHNEHQISPFPHGTEVVTIRLKNRDVDGAARLLREVFAEPAVPNAQAGERGAPSIPAPGTGIPAATGPPSDQEAPPSPPAIGRAKSGAEFGVEIVARSEAHTIQIRGTPVEVAFIRSFLQEYDQSSTSSLLLRRCPLKHPSAARIEKSLTDLFAPSIPNPAGSGSPENQPARNILTLKGAAGKSLVIAARKEEMAILLPVIAELDLPPLPDRTQKRYRLTYADPVRMKNRLEAIFHPEQEELLPQSGDPPGPPPPAPDPQGPAAFFSLLGTIAVVADPRTASVQVTAPTEMIPLVDAFILALDLPSSKPQPDAAPPRKGQTQGTRPPNGSPRPRPH